MSATRCLWAMAVGLALAGSAVAQLEDDLYQKPEKPAEFWRAAKYEITQGKFDIASAMLRGFLDSKPTDKDFADIEEKEGIAGFLRLRNVPKWFEDKDKDKAARETVEAVIRSATDAINRTLSDPVRIRRYIGNLSASPEEREYALAQLRRSGVNAAPILVEILSGQPDSEERTGILTALPQLPSSVVPPIVASLDAADRDLKLQLLRSLADRPDIVELTGVTETNVLPQLAWLSESPAEGGAVRTVAAAFRKRLRERLRLTEISPKTELTESAEQFLNHRAKFLDPTTVTLWRWDGAKPVPAPFTITQAEEYYGLRDARRALTISAADEPAQVTFLTLAIEKATERAGLAADLATAAPGVYDMLAASPPALLRSVLDRALNEGRTAVALAVIRVLTDRGEAALSDVRREPKYILVRALDYPDRRIRLAAAEGLARLPAGMDHQAHVRVVEVLRGALAAEPEPGTPEADKPRVLIGDPDSLRAVALARLARAAGYSPVLVDNGKDAVRRVFAASDIDVVLVDHQLAAPELPKLLAELKTDPRAAGLPVRVMLGTRVDPTRVPDPAGRIRRLAEPYRGVSTVAEPFSPAAMAQALQPNPTRPSELPLTPEERAAAAKRAVETLRMLAAGPKPGYDVRPALPAIIAALRDDALALPAIETVERFDGKEIQTELSALVLNPARPLPLRVRATEAVIASAARDGLLVPEGRVKELGMAAADEKTEPELRAKLAALLGRVRPDPKSAGEKLLQYTPPDPTAPPPKEPPPKE